MNLKTDYDIAIVGGGLAGLAYAILMARKGYRVLLAEKETYPRHKVCGEYISLESRPFLQSLGISVTELNLPLITKLLITDTRNTELSATLPQGGFGISRYMLDKLLANNAIRAGVTLLTNTRIDSVSYASDVFTLAAGDRRWTARIACGAWGKRSNVDVKMQRSFLTEKHKGLNNYVGIKYHIRYNWPADTIGLHNFSNGYCGISRIEDNKTCLCYLTTAANLKKSGNDIKTMERNILMRNKWLRDILPNAEMLYAAPLAISQISFQQKEQVLDHMLLLGDAAGSITPLCGNGMSMALHAAKIAATLTHNYLSGTTSRADMEAAYTQAWKTNFATRTAVGRLVQANFGKDLATTLFLRTFKVLPFLQRPLISLTSGREF
jgi:flavin-dependent dehydrogenase